MPVDLNKHSVEELEALLRNSGVTKAEPAHLLELKYFLSNFNIVAGDHRCSYKNLFALYNHWTQTPMALPHFKTNINKLIPKKGLGLSLNITSIELVEKLVGVASNKILEIPKLTTEEKIFNQFTEYYSINSGSVLCNEQDLIFLYDLWCFKNKKRSGSVENLKIILKNSYKKMVTKNTTYYYLTPNVNTIIQQEKIRNEKKST